MPSSLTYLLVLITTLPLAATACGGPDPGSAPIAGTPLSGVINGQAFTAKSAIAVTLGGSPPGERAVTISNAMISCTMGVSGPALNIPQVPWKAGAAYALDSQHQVIVVFDSSNSQTDAMSGRVEVIKVPAGPGDKATFRVRVELDDKNHVEGQVDVDDC